MAGWKAQHRFASVRFDGTHRHIDAGLVFGKWPFLYIAIFAQAPTALFQGFRLECLQSTGARHPWPNWRAFRAADDIFPGRATVILASWPQIFLSLGEAFFQVVFSKF